MNRIYFSITGTNHHYGQEFFEPKMSVRLVKEPDNEVDITQDYRGDFTSSQIQ